MAHSFTATSSEHWFAEGRKVFDENRLTVADCASADDAEQIAADRNARAEGATASQREPMERV